MSLMNIAKIFVWFFFFLFIRAWKKMTFMFWIKKDSFWKNETECLNILKILLWAAEEIEVDHD